MNSKTLKAIYRAIRTLANNSNKGTFKVKRTQNSNLIRAVRAITSDLTNEQIIRLANLWDAESFEIKTLNHHSLAVDFFMNALRDEEVSIDTALDNVRYLAQTKRVPCPAL